METALEIFHNREGEGRMDYLPLFSSRECHQTLSLVAEEKQFHRTINGELIYVQGSSSQKYQTLIKCTDQNPIALGGKDIGKVFLIHCLQMLFTPLQSGVEEMILERYPVPGTVILQRSDGGIFPLEVVEGKRVSLAEIEVDQRNGMVCYRPALKMCLRRFQLETEEWASESKWCTEFEEV